VLAGTAFLITGCSTVQPPRDKIGAAELALQQAETSKAAQYAGAELRMARDKLEHAKRAMNDERYQDARRLAEQAMVDAQLAASSAQSLEAQQLAHEMRESIESLRQETDRADQFNAVRSSKGGLR
jgi:hypothetical protein